jgi:hypothetical protein
MGIRGIGNLIGDGMDEEKQDLPDKPEAPEVVEVKDEEIDKFAEESNVDEEYMTPEEAEDDDTVDNHENDTPPEDSEAE